MAGPDLDPELKTGAPSALKSSDPFLFLKAEEFFHRFDSSGSKTRQPSSISYFDEDQRSKNGLENPVCRYGAIFRFDTGALLLIQFVRPKLWRLRFEQVNKEAADFKDYNTFVSIYSLYLSGLTL